MAAIINQIPLAVAIPLAAVFFFALAAMTGNRRFDYVGKLVLCLFLAYVVASSGPYLWQVKKTMLVIQRAM